MCGGTESLLEMPCLKKTVSANPDRIKDFLLLAASSGIPPEEAAGVEVIMLGLALY